MTYHGVPAEAGTQGQAEQQLSALQTPGLLLSQEYRYMVGEVTTFSGVHPAARRKA
jgi:hypothetical protein